MIKALIFAVLMVAISGCISNSNEPAVVPLVADNEASFEMMQMKSQLEAALASSGEISPETYGDIKNKIDSLENSGHDVQELRQILSRFKVGGQSVNAPQQSGTSMPVLKNLGVTFGALSGQRAGDFLFLDGTFDDKIIVEFGLLVNGTNGAKLLPELTYSLPVGTPVVSPIDGIVDRISIIEWSKDYAVHLKNGSSEWIVSYEHLINLKVSEGESVRAGQVVGEAAPYTGNGIAELVVWKGGQEIIKHCPFDALEASLKPVYEEKIMQLVADWEKFKGKNIYDEEKWVMPGCLRVEMTETEANNPASAASGNSAQSTAPPKPVGLFGQECSDGDGILSVSPLEISKLEFIEPQGRVASSHVTPTDHQYWQPFGFVHGSPQNDVIRFDVLSPADGYVIDVGEFRPGDYRLVLEHSCSLYTIFIHLNELPDKISSVIGTHPIRVPVAAGEVIGRKNSYTFDFSVHDTNIVLDGLIVPEHYSEVWKIHTVDPFDYFPETLASQLREKSLRSAAPVGGKINYDVEGTIQGNWFLEGTGGYGGTNTSSYWRTHLSIVYDHIDPSQIRVSIGDYGGKEIQYGVKGNNPLPSSVTQSSGAVKYELVDYVYLDGSAAWDGKTHAKLTSKNQETVEGILLVQHLGNRRMKVEVFPGKTASQVTGFTSAAKIYER